MGEYIEYQGQHLKVGTCEDLMYVRYEEMQRLAPVARRVDGNLDPNEYARPYARNGSEPIGTWMYRFPFPGEDGRGLDEIAGCEPEVPSRRAYVLDGAEVEAPHDHVWRSISLDGTYNVNVRVPCPHLIRATPEPWRTSPVPAMTPILPVRERLLSTGGLYTVFACGWCDARFSLSPGELAKLYVPDGFGLGERLRAKALP